MSDILKSWVGKLYAWAFPSALALGAGWLIVVSQRQGVEAAVAQLFGKTGTSLFLAVTVALSICLYAVQTPLYRILEGYRLWPESVARWGRDRELARKRRLAAAVAGQRGWHRGLALERLARLPLNDDQILPTRFGNAIRSFETYGKTRFNLDTQTLWYELCSAAPKYLTSQVDDARSSVDFFVATFYLSLALSSVLVVAAIWIAPLLVVFALASLSVAMGSHWMAVRTIDEWSYAVQAVVNVGRVKLAVTLGLTLPQTLEEERRMWGLVTRYVLRRDKDAGLALNPFRAAKPAAPADDGDAEDGDEDAGDQDPDDDEDED